MSDWLESLSTLQVLLLVVGVLVGLAVLAAIAGAVLVRFGASQPWVVRRINALTETALGLVKRPLTIVVLDEVAAVIQTGHYTKNISDALLENQAELKSLVAEKVRRDPNVRLIGKLPGYDTVVSEVSETTLRVIIEMLGDPRMDELVSDLLRNNSSRSSWPSATASTSSCPRRRPPTRCRPRSSSPPAALVTAHADRHPAAALRRAAVLWDTDLHVL